MWWPFDKLSFSNLSSVQEVHGQSFITVVIKRDYLLCIIRQGHIQEPTQEEKDWANITVSVRIRIISCENVLFSLVRIGRVHRVRV